MAGDERPTSQPADAIGVGFQRLIEDLRDDVREDIRDLRGDLGKTEERVTARVAAVESEQKATRGLIEKFAYDHGQEHESEAKDRREAHGTFYEFMRRFELDEARRQGALGVLRFSLELISRHASRLGWILVALGTAFGLATGTIGVKVGG